MAEDEAHDLAVLRVEGDAPAVLPLSDRTPAAGERVWVVTRFGASEATVTGLATDEALGPVVMLSAPGLGPGSSGGAVVDAGGHAVGVVWGAEDGDQPRVGAIPAGRVRALLATIPAR